MTRKALALGALAALLAVGTAQASDSYRVTAGGNQDWGPQTGGLDETSPTPLDERGTMTDGGNVVGTADYRVQAGPGIVRAAMHGGFTVPSNLAYPFNPSLQAVATTELTIAGPEPEVTTSLNLHVDGVLDDSVCGAGASCGALSVHIIAPGGTTASAGSEFNGFGETRTNELGLQFERVAGGYRVHGDVTSAQFGLPTGRPVPIHIVLNLSGRFGGNAARSTFGGDFADPAKRLQVSFAPSGPVLNLPDGYTVSGNGVVGNRWDDPFAGDLVATGCDDPALAQATTIRGSLIVRGLTGCPTLAFPQLTHIGGDIVIEDDRAPRLAFPGPVLVDGSVRVVGNDGGGAIGIGAGSVAGTVDISGNGGDLDVGIGSVAGTVDISGTGGDLDVGIGSVAGTVDINGTGGDLDVGIGSVAGTVDISGTGGDLTLDPGTVGGDLTITDNPDAGVVDVGSGQVGGDLTIADNGTAAVDANDPLTVSGDADVETGGGGMLDLSGVEAEGDETIAAGDAEGVSAVTAGGTTDVAILGGTAAMHVVLPDGAFDRPVAFTIARRGDDPAEAGVDPLAGYAFTFAVPALDADARLSFTVDLAALDPPTRAALLAGIASGTATIASKTDQPGSTYAAFARCAPGQTPEADGCVAVTLEPASGEPALARFDGIAGHFSTYAVALLRPKQSAPPATSPAPRGAAAARPTAAQILALLRTQIAPHGKAGRIKALLAHGYRLPFRALIAGSARVEWSRKGTVMASGRRTFSGAGTATIAVRLTKAGRKALRRAKRLSLTAKGTFTPAPDPPVTATRRFTLRR